MDRASLLTAARELDGYHVSPTVADVRGWEVLANDGTVVGRVARLLVDMKSRRIRYVMVNLQGSRAQSMRPARAVLVPVGTARRNDAERRIHLDLAADVIARAPHMPWRPITREEEDATLAALGLPLPIDLSDFQRYHGTLFDETRLVAARHMSKLTPAAGMPAIPEPRKPRR